MRKVRTLRKKKEETGWGAGGITASRRPADVSQDNQGRKRLLKKLLPESNNGHRLDMFVVLDNFPESHADIGLEE